MVILVFLCFTFGYFILFCCCCFVVSCFVVNVRVSIKKKPFLPFVFVYFITYNFLFFFLLFFDSHVTTTTNNNCTQFIQMKNSKRHTGRTLLLFIYTFWCTAPSDGKWTKKTTTKKKLKKENHHENYSWFDPLKKYLKIDYGIEYI